MFELNTRRNMRKDKKGMQLGDLYGFVLLIGLVAILIGIVVLVLDKLGQSSGITSNASEAINASVGAIVPIASTWLPLVVTIAVLGIILGIVLTSFAVRKMGR